MKKLKKIVIAITTLALLLTMGISTMLTALAAPATSLFNGTINFNSTAYYGQEGGISIPHPAGVVVKVTAPNGKELTEGDGITVSGGVANFDAAMVGYYTVSYTNGDAMYNKFQIHVTLEDTWTLKVPFNGATIPTYVKMSTTDDVTLPAASAVVYDEDGEVAKTSDAVTVSVINPDGDAEVLTADNKFKPSKLGTYFVRYTFAYPGGTEYCITKDYEIKSQKDFSDTVNPEISLTNPTEEINLNVAYTLPKATAKDNYDENVQIVITVTDPDGGKVYQAEVDKKTGYATGIKKDAEGNDLEVEFDVNGNLKFYPMKTGLYHVVYQAIDDSNNKSTPKPYDIKVVDKLAPVITVDETAIPYTWGNVVKKAQVDANGAAVVVGGVTQSTTLANTDIVFPYPEVVDNAGADEITLIGFSIKNSKGTEIINFENLLNSTTANYTNTSDVSTPLTFSAEDGLRFNFTWFKADTRTGEYTVTYTAKDASKTATKSYTINYTSTVEDLEKPVAAIVDFPAYITVDDTDYTTYTIPAVSLTETVSKTRTAVKVYLNIGGTKYLVEEGDKIKFTSDLELTTEAGVKQAVTYGNDPIILQIWAKDHVGNEFTSVDSEYTAQVINKDSYGDAAYTIANTLDLNDVLVDTKKDLGGFTVTSTKDNTEINYDYIAYEIVVTDPENNVVSSTEADVIFGDLTDANLVLSVSNITFIPGKSGEYKVTIRVFDISGNTAISSAKFNITVDDETSLVDAITWPTTLQQGKVFTMGKATATKGTDPVAVKIHVKGAHYAMSAKQFIAYAESNYAVTYYSAPVSGTAKQLAEYNFKATDTSVPEIQIVGSVPVYSKLSTADEEVLVKLPHAVGIAQTGIIIQNNDGLAVAYKVQVTDKNGDVVNLTVVDGHFAFMPQLDGKYTIKYTVNGYNDSNYVTITMSAGDIQAPNFTVTAHKGTASIDSNFKFNAITVEGEDYDELTFTKLMTAPDGTVYTTTGTGTSAASREVSSSSSSSGFKMTQSGTYTVTYTVKDKAGNESKQTFTITVAAASSNAKISTAVISTILVIVGVLLLIGVGIYLWKGRPIKEEV